MTYRFTDRNLPEAGGGWATCLDLNFINEPSQTLNANQNYTIAGKTWTKELSAQDAVAMAITLNTGLVIQPVQVSDLWQTTRTVPILRTALNAHVPNFNVNIPIRASLYLSAYTNLTTTSLIGFGIASDNTALYRTTYVQVPNNRASQTHFNSVLADEHSNTTNNLTNNVWTLLWPKGLAQLRSFQAYSGAWSSGWPVFSTMLAEYARVEGTTLSLPSYMGAVGGWNLLMWCARNGNAAATTATIGAVKIEYIL